MRDYIIAGILTLLTSTVCLAFVILAYNNPAAAVAIVLTVFFVLFFSLSLYLMFTGFLKMVRNRK